MRRKQLGYVAATTLLVLGLGMAVFNNDSVRRSNGNEKQKLQYVLVNEDTGTQFDDQSYNLGLNLVNRMSRDTKSNWTTASLPVANEGVKNGSYDAEIIIPQDFSERLLDLNSMNPSKANIQFKIRDGKNEAVTNEIEKQVGDVVNDFNQQVITMYFSSIVNSLSEAQRNVSGIVNGQQQDAQMMSANITNQMKTVPNTTQSFAQNTAALSEQNSQFTQEQKLFTDRTQDNLTKTVQGLNSGVGNLDDYLAQQNTMQSLNLLNGNAALKSQSETDADSYTNQFDQFNDVTQMQLQQLLSTDGTSGLLADSRMQGEQFKNNQQARKDEIKATIDHLNGQSVELDEMKSAIATEYFGNQKLTEKDTLSADDFSEGKEARQQLDQLIKDKMSPTTEDDKGTKLSLKGLQTAVQNTGNLQELRQLVMDLHSKQVISTTQAERYNQMIHLTEAYAKENNLETDKGSFGFTYQQAADNDDLTKNRSVEKSSYVFGKVSGTEPTTLALHQIDAETVGTGTDIQISAAESSDRRLYTTSVSADRQSVTITPKTGTDEKDTIDLAGLRVSVVMQVPSNAIQDDKNSGYFQTGYDFSLLGGKTVGHTTSSLYVEKSANSRAIERDLDKILLALTNVSQSANMLGVIYGNPNDVDAIGSLDSAIKQQTFDTVADKESVYRLYNRLTNEQQSALIADSVRDDIIKKGVAAFNNVSQQKQKIDDTVNNVENGLDKTLQLMSDPALLSEETQKSIDWYNGASAALQLQYETWQKNPTMQLNAAPYDGSTETNQRVIYHDNGQAKQLMGDFNNLSKNSETLAQQTGATFDGIGTMDNQFKTLTDASTQVTQSVKKLADDAESLDAKMASDASKNGEYATQFSGVLQNTRNGGAINEPVFDFFTNPLTVTGARGSEAKETSILPYLLTIITLLVSLAGAVFLKRYSVFKTVDASNRFDEQSRLWFNQPMLGRTLLVSLGLGSLTAGLLFVMLNGQPNRLALSGTILLVVFVETILLTGLLRFFKRTGWFWILFMIGFYLLLTPFIGQSISGEGWFAILYRLSPLQNVENLFAVITVGGGISLWAIIGVGLLFGLGLGLNAFVKVTPDEDMEHA